MKRFQVLALLLIILVQNAINKNGDITFEGKGWFNATFGFDEQNSEQTKDSFTYDESNGILRVKEPKQQWKAGTFENGRWRIGAYSFHTPAKRLRSDWNRGEVGAACSPRSEADSGKRAYAGR